MTETTRACILGCTMYRQHLTDCDNPDTCRGCLPRRATHGLLCTADYRRFKQLLTDAPTLHRWLTGNLAAGQSQVMDDIGHGKVKQKRKGTESPAPLNVTILDTKALLADRLAIWVDHHVEDSGVTGPTVHTPEADAEHLIRWIDAIAWWDIVADWITELAECFTDAHAVAPWRPVTRRVRGIPCPNEHCGEMTLVIYGGDSDVTCTRCRTIILEKHLPLWEDIVRQELEAAG